MRSLRAQHSPGFLCVHGLAIFRKFRNMITDPQLLNAWNSEDMGWYNPIYHRTSYAEQYRHDYVQNAILGDLRLLPLSAGMRAWPGVKNKGRPKTLRIPAKDEAEYKRKHACFPVAKQGTTQGPVHRWTSPLWRPAPVRSPREQ